MKVFNPFITLVTVLVTLLGLFILTISFSQQAMAAPGNLSNDPLQVTANAPPNIMFLIDDSGSMDNEIGGGNTDIRWEILLTSMNTVLDDLNRVYVGIASFKNDSQIKTPMTLLDSSLTGTYATTLSSLKADVAALGGAGPGYNTLGGEGTILGKTMHDIGRYFANGAGDSCGSGTSGADGDLVIHPGVAGLEATHKCEKLLGKDDQAIGQGEPVIFSCQKNFVIALSDGLTRKDKYLRSSGGTTFSLTNHPFHDYDQDCTAANQTAGDYACTSLDRKEGGTNKDYTYESVDDGGSDFFDDITTALYDIDLRPDYTEYKNNIATYTVGFADASLDPASASFNPLMRSAAKQAGGTFSFANDVDSLVGSIADAVNAIAEQSGTASAISFNSSTLNSNSAAFQAKFNTVSWDGEVNSLPINSISGAITNHCPLTQIQLDAGLTTCCTVGTDAGCWTASSAMDSQAHTDREIMTYASGNKGIEFDMPDAFNYTSLTSSTLPQTLIDDLCQGVDIPFPCNDSTAANATEKAANRDYMIQLVDYLRGDRSRENQIATPKFRKRASVLGDVVNATPVFVGKPTLGKQRPDVSPFPTGTDAYSIWEKTTAVRERTPVLYAAANDGMLHALKAADGSEMMAYVPTGTFSSTSQQGLHYLADPTYSHRFYVDLSPSVSDVWMKHRDANGGVTQDPAWRTVLLGGQRQGGRTLFLLDITDPDKFADVGANADEIALWEFTHDDLGYSFSKPTITMMNNNKFAAVFGNGYNSGIDGNGDCRAKLFILYLEDGLNGWTSSDYQIIDTGSGGAGDACNGLSTPTLVDLNRDGRVDRAYAGDLNGNLWAFDLCNDADGTCLATGWGVGYSSGGSPAPIMTAHDGTNPQPITVKPAVSLDPLSANTTDVIIAFGTGQYITMDDLTETQLQTIYAVREADALTNGGSSGLNPRSGGSKFKIQKLQVDDCDAVEQTGCSVGRTVDQPDAGTNSKGWMVDLYDNVTAAGSGERVIANPKIRNNNLFINTLIPESGTCAKGGDGWVMAFNLADGDQPQQPVWDIHVDGVFDAQDTFTNDNIAVTGIKKGFPGESTFLGKKMYTPCEQGLICEDDVNVGKTQREGRMSWKELYEAN